MRYVLYVLSAFSATYTVYCCVQNSLYSIFHDTSRHILLLLLPTVQVSVNGQHEEVEDGNEALVITRIPTALRKAVCDGISDSLGYGPTFGYPMHAVAVELIPQGDNLQHGTTHIG